MKLAIMQPYFFPYIGYFQLVNAVDKFVFYDDVNYINRGWINRNRILVNNKPTYITVQLKEASQNKLINEIEIIDNRQKIGKTIQMAYAKAPYFEQTWPLVNNVLSYQTNLISELAIKSVTEVCRYLGFTTEFEVSSQNYSDTKNLERTERIITICKRNKANEYYNSLGGVGLYSKEDFKKDGIALNFINTAEISYNQFNQPFTPFLSIIDMMMFCSVSEIIYMLNSFNLI